MIVPNKIISEPKLYENYHKDFEFESLFHTISVSKRIIKKVFKYKRKGTVLHYGCGKSILLQLLKNLDWDVYGIDISKEAIEFNLNNNIPTHKSSYFGRNMFDVIVARNLIEHLPDPKGFLSEMRRILKSDGIFMLSTPNTDSINFMVNKKKVMDYPEHLYLFNRKNLTRLFGKLFYVEEYFNTNGWLGIFERASFVQTVGRIVSNILNRQGEMVFILR